MINQKHKERFKKLLRLDNTNLKDNERKSLFWILSGNNDLYKNVKSIYDFKSHEIQPECLEHNISNSSYQLIALAYHLYNGYNKSDILDIFSALDESNFNLAINAIKIRFNKNLY